MNIIDWDATDRRLLQMDEIAMSAPENKNSLLEFFCNFLGSFSLSITKCTPNDVRRFLVWKDSKGKTIVHKLCCPFLGSKTNFECNCLA